MSRVKEFKNLSLLEQIERVVKNQLPKDCTITLDKVSVQYSLLMNVTTEANPFQVTLKDYTIVTNYTDNNVEVIIKDGDKTIKETVISLQPE